MTRESSVVLPTAAERLAQSHAIEWAEGWQYGTVWRFARDTDPQPVLGPPAGDGWEVNVDYAGGGLSVRTPVWSDGSIVQQLTHWRRPAEGVTWRSRWSVHEQVTWPGDPKPAAGPA